MAEKPDILIDLLKGIDLKLSIILGKMIKLNKSDIVIKDEIKELYQSGVDSKTISQILGIPIKYATEEISRLKKKSNKEKTNDPKKSNLTRK
jgi:hypothetical protein